MKKYENYKDSGVEWLGKIPSDWQFEKIKFHIHFEKGKNPKELTDENNSEFPVYLSVDYLRGKQKNIQYVKDVTNCSIINNGEILLLWDGANAGEFMVGKNGVLSSTMCKVSFNKKLSKTFGWYVLITYEKEIREVTIGMGIPHVNGYDLNSSYIPLPPLPEQLSIVNFLDHTTERIDRFIANRKKQIELSKEKKAAIINKAVTKGINPNAKMKDSGIEWIGKIPEHWKIWKVSRLFKKIGSGTTPKAGTPAYYENGTIPWVNTGDLNDGILYNCGTFITKKAYIDHSTLKIYNKETLLIAMYGATIAKLSILNFDACTNQACCALSNSKLIKIDFAFNWFLSQKQNIINLSYGGGQPNISQDIVRSIRIPLPPSKEQYAIIEYIKSETSTIDALITKYQKQIDLMQEYRTALISQAVTGKIDVRNWQAKKKKYNTPETQLLAAAEKTEVYE